jgi:hypothetical protein
MFQSVGDFLRKATSAKSDDRQRISEEIAPTLEDPYTVGIPLELRQSIDRLMVSHGDEAIRQTALCCLARWMEIHSEFLEQHQLTESMEEALLTVADATRLCMAMEMISNIGSFGGDDSWRAMLNKTLTQEILEASEEDGIDLDAMFGGRA